MGQTLKEKAIPSRFRIGQPNDRGPKGANLNGPFSMKVEELLLCLITGSWQSYGSLRWQEVRGFTMRECDSIYPSQEVWLITMPIRLGGTVCTFSRCRVRLVGVTLTSRSVASDRNPGPRGPLGNRKKVLAQSKFVTV